MINFSDAEIFENDFEKMENFVEKFSKNDIDKMFNPVLSPIISLFQKTKNADECMDKLAEIYPQKINFIEVPSPAGEG